jgi:hypothetical protein
MLQQLGLRPQMLWPRHAKAAPDAQAASKNKLPSIVQTVRDVYRLWRH